MFNMEKSNLENIATEKLRKITELNKLYKINFDQVRRDYVQMVNTISLNNFTLGHEQLRRIKLDFLARCKAVELMSKGKTISANRLALHKYQLLSDKKK
jgi:hypothetical protein